MISLDKIDRRILERLQLDGRLSNADLAEQVGVFFAGSCWSRRWKRRASSRATPRQVDAKSVGLSVNRVRERVALHPEREVR